MQQSGVCASHAHYKHPLLVLQTQQGRDDDLTPTTELARDDTKLGLLGVKRTSAERLPQLECKTCCPLQPMKHFVQVRRAR